MHILSTLDTLTGTKDVSGGLKLGLTVGAFAIGRRFRAGLRQFGDGDEFGRTLFGLVEALLQQTRAATEAAVAAFQERRLHLTAIPAVIEAVMERATGGAIGGLEDVLAADADSRMHARERIVRLTAGARGAHA